MGLRATGRNNAVAVAWTWALTVVRRLHAIGSDTTAANGRVLMVSIFPRFTFPYVLRASLSKRTSPAPFFFSEHRRAKRGFFETRALILRRLSRVSTAFRRAHSRHRFPRRPHQCCRSARNDPSRHRRDTLSGFAHKAVTAR